MAAVYSTPFLQLPSFSGTATYAVPVGMLIVVRDIDVVYGSVVDLEVTAEDGSGCKFFGDTLNGGFGKSTASWRGRQVIRGPGLLRVSANATCDVRVSGYLLAE